MSGTGFLPYGRQSIDEDDVAAVAGVLRSDWLTTGPEVGRFEAAFAEATGARFAVSCSSGTAALHLAVLALGLDAGGAVVVPSISFLATANVVRHAGAEVVFSDIDPDTGLMRPRDLEAALARAGRPPVRALLPVHLNGQCADAAAIADVAERHGLRVIEDACHALGGAQLGAGGARAPVGACRWSDLACFSLHPVKAIAMGEGGVVTTGDAALHARLLELRNHGMVRDPARFENAEAFDSGGAANPWYYELHEPGFNYRASDIHCALARSQLGRLRRFVERRAALVAAYDEALAPLAPLVRPLGRVAHCEPAWHLYVARVDFERAGMERAALMRALRERGIGTQVHYFPLHRQPYYRRHADTPALPGADAYYAQALSLPLFPDMTGADVARVAVALGECLGRGASA